MAEKTYQVGDRFGHWTMVERVPYVGRNIKWLCECDCGIRCVVFANNVTSGRSTRCQTCRTSQRRGRKEVRW